MRRSLGWLGLVAAVYAGAFALVYWLSVRTVRGRVLSDASLRGALSTGSSVSETVDATLNVVSVASLAGAIAVVASIALLRLDRARGLAAIGVVVGANLSARVLKDFLISRPDLGVDEVAPATLNSLPGGHTTAACSAVVALVLVLPRRWRSVATAVGAGYVTLTGVATMTAGWHRAGDSMAAVLLVGVWACVAAALVVVLEPVAVEGTTVTGATTVRFLGVVSVGAFVVGLALLLFLDAVDSFRATDAGAVVAFFVGALLITGTVSAVLASLLAVLNRTDADLERRPAPSTGRP